MPTILALQFGNVYQRRAPGYRLLSRLYTHPSYLWATPVNEGASLGVDDPLLEGFVRAARPAELWLGLSDGDYKVTVTVHDPAAAHGPFAVEVEGETVAQVEAAAGEVRTVRFAARARRSSLRLCFVPAPGKDLLLNAVTVEGPAGRNLLPLFASTPVIDLPSRPEAIARGQDDAAAMLKRVCDWLVDHRRENGFLGDAYESGQQIWYTVSMPVRALLAAYEVLGHERYRDVALSALDDFVAEQLPNGAWMDHRRGTPTAALAPAEVERLMAEARQPMSDIGSVVTATALGAGYAGAARRQTYLAAVTHFCDGWAARYQEPSGAFTDGRWGRGYETGVYSCATTIEAAAHAIISARTGEPHFLQSAERAMRFLLPDWQPNGRMIGRAPHWQVRNRQPFLMEPLYFGDLWYYDEGFITVACHTGDAGLRGQLDEALRWRVFGAEGLLAALGNGAWWPVQDIWDNAKSIGEVQTLLYARTRLGSSPALDDALAGLQHILCTPAYARTLGVMVQDEERPARLHTVRTWSGMGMEATGFAGMTLAEMLKPGVLYAARG